MTSPQSPRIAVLLPCYNEEAAIGQVVAGFRARCPARDLRLRQQQRDGTARAPPRPGAIVRTERQQGKGHVVRRMFADVDADVYVMADGDLTYDPAAAPAMVERLLDEQLDMVVGTRRHEERRPTAAATASATALHRPGRADSSGAASATSSPATGSSRAAS